MSGSTGRTPAIARVIAGTGLDATDVEGTLADAPEYRFDVEHTVGLLATALARLHQTPVLAPDAAVPVLDPERLVALARAAIADGRVTADSLSEAYRHLTPDRLVAVLAERRATSAPAGTDDVVLTHGRPSLSRLRCRDGALVGFIGWDRAALADRHRDLAVAARCIASDLGPMLVPSLVERYAAEVRQLGGTFSSPEPLRLDWYALAAELTR